MRVQLFGTCLIDTFFPETGEATVKLLRRFGVEVMYPHGQTCCGKPADSGGYTRESKKAAEHFISVFEATEGPIIIPSGSCASMVKNHYPALFRDDDRMKAKSVAIADRVYELTQFLVHVLRAHEAGLEGKGRLTYHASCQLTRELGVKEEPLQLLHSLKGAEVIPLANADRCCGFGGIFSAKLPEVSTCMADEKVDNIVRTGADTVTGCDHGCLMNIAAAAKRRGSPFKVKHIASVLAEAIT